MRFSVIFSLNIPEASISNGSTVTYGRYRLISFSPGFLGISCPGAGRVIAWRCSHGREEQVSDQNPPAGGTLVAGQDYAHGKVRKIKREGRAGIKPHFFPFF